MAGRVAPLSVRWMLTLALAFSAFALGSFGYLFLTTTQTESARIDAAALSELALVARSSAADVPPRVRALLASDEHRTRFAAVFDARGRRIAGNVSRIPEGLARDGRMRDTIGVRADDRGRKVENMRAGARVLDSGQTILIGSDLDARDQTRNDLGVAILAGLLPALAVALAFGAAFGVASQRRIRTIEAAIDRIVAGDFTGRLPVTSGRGETDRIALGVNRMLDAIETLYDEIRGVGDDMAHDLRTPLGRVRAQLERSRETARTVDDFHVAIDRAITGLDQALAVIIAILRIGQIEHRARRSEFARVDLSALARDVVDLYAPIAEDAHVDLTIDADAPADIDGDRDLLFEALANLLDNAIKFAPYGGHVVVRTSTSGEAPTLVVADDGPGIPENDRANVLKRFIRGDKSRHVSGNGLGLSLVVAIARLHDASLTIGDCAPGCIVRVDFRAAQSIRSGPAVSAEAATL